MTSHELVATVFYQTGDRDQILGMSSNGYGPLCHAFPHFVIWSSNTQCNAM